RIILGGSGPSGRRHAPCVALTVVEGPAVFLRMNVENGPVPQTGPRGVTDRACGRRTADEVEVGVLDGGVLVANGGESSAAVVLVLRQYRAAGAQPIVIGGHPAVCVVFVGDPLTGTVPGGGHEAAARLVLRLFGRPVVVLHADRSTETV